MTNKNEFNATTAPASNRTVVSSVDKGSWTGSVIRQSGDVRVTVNSVSELFLRSAQLGNIKNK